MVYAVLEQKNMADSGANTRDALEPCAGWAVDRSLCARADVGVYFIANFVSPS